MFQVLSWNKANESHLLQTSEASQSLSVLISRLFFKDEHNKVLKYSILNTRDSNNHSEIINHTLFYQDCIDL